MSQKPTPKSPKSPRSKSPSCEDVEGSPEQYFEDLQRAVEEELRSSDRILSEARNSIAGSKGRSNQSRASYQRSTSKPPSRIPSPRAGSTYEEEPRLPSPPVSPLTYGSRAATPGASHRGSRIPSPENSGMKTFTVDGEEDVCPEGTEAYKYSSRGTPTNKSPVANSKVGSVTFGSKQGSYSAQARYANEMATSVAGLNAGGRDMALSAMQMHGMQTDATTSCVKMGPSYMEAGTSNMRMGQYTDTGTSNMRMGQYADTGTSCLRMGSTYVNAPGSSSRIGASRMEMGTSGMGLTGGVDAGTSAMNYKMSKDRSHKNAGPSSCSPGCKKFMKEIEEVQPFSSTPIRNSDTARRPDATFICNKQQDACSHAGGRLGSPAPDHQMPPESGHHGHHQVPARDPKSTFDRSSPPGMFDSHAKSPHDGHEHHHHHGESPDRSPPRDEKMVSALGHLAQLRKTPSYFRCELNQGLDFLKVCCPKSKEASKSRPARFPEMPCLRQEELDDLIKCETQDVDSAWYLMSDERKTYKKPCPKQQKAQMTVKALMQAHAGQICSQKEQYSPLEHPDPEDISPEVAAAMMFSQERGIKMEECPNDTITSLFPDEPKPPFPEKIPPSSISIVDRSSKDQEEMIEKSASVPSDGVSDSAYTRTMRGKGEDLGPQKSFDVDFAIGQSKREYIIVAQKPQRVNKVQYRGNTPPWFPGFLSAFPDDDGLNVVTSPSGLFHKAWVHSNPGNMPTSDVIVLD